MYGCCPSAISRGGRSVPSGKIRSLHYHALKDALLTELDDGVKILFHYSANHADDRGVFADEPTEIQMEIFPNQVWRPITEMVDLLVAVGLFKRMVTPDGVRVLRITNFLKYQHPKYYSQPAFCWLWELSEVPEPTKAQREALGARFDVKSWDEPIPVECEKCGDTGRLRFAKPLLGADSSSWYGSVVAGRVEIVPDDKAEDGVRLLCRDCRTDTVYTGPSGKPVRRNGVLVDEDWKGKAVEDGRTTRHQEAPSSGGHQEEEKGDQATGQSSDSPIVELAGRRRGGKRSKQTFEEGSVSAEVWSVFSTWRSSTGNQDAALTAGRVGVIVEALNNYPIDDVLDAVQGWEYIAYNRGENPDAVPVNELGLILKDHEHIDKFRDAKRKGSKTTTRNPQSRRASANVSSFEGESRTGDWGE